MGGPPSPWESMPQPPRTLLNGRAPIIWAYGLAIGAGVGMVIIGALLCWVSYQRIYGGYDGGLAEILTPGLIGMLVMLPGMLLSVRLIPTLPTLIQAMDLTKHLMADRSNHRQNQNHQDYY